MTDVSRSDVRNQGSGNAGHVDPVVMKKSVVLSSSNGVDQGLGNVINSHWDCQIALSDDHRWCRPQAGLSSGYCECSRWLANQTSVSRPKPFPRCHLPGLGGLSISGLVERIFSRVPASVERTALADRLVGVSPESVFYLSSGDESILFPSSD